MTGNIPQLQSIAMSNFDFFALIMFLFPQHRSSVCSVIEAVRYDNNIQCVLIDATVNDVTFLPGYSDRFAILPPGMSSCPQLVDPFGSNPLKLIY